MATKWLNSLNTNSIKISYMCDFNAQWSGDMGQRKKCEQGFDITQWIYHIFWDKKYKKLKGLNEPISRMLMPK